MLFVSGHESAPDILVIVIKQVDWFILEGRILSLYDRFLYRLFEIFFFLVGLLLFFLKQRYAGL